MTESPAAPDDLPWKIVGAVVATLLGLAIGLVTAFWAPLFIPFTNLRAPISLLLAILLNPMLAWFAVVVTGRRLAAILPALAWCGVWVLAAGRTTEGDLIITGNNWVGLVTLLVGPIAFAAGVMFQMRPRRLPAPQPDPVGVQPPAGSGAAPPA